MSNNLGSRKIEKNKPYDLTNDLLQFFLGDRYTHSITMSTNRSTPISTGSIEPTVESCRRLHDCCKCNN